jgi:hypothetical protein
MMADEVVSAESVDQQYGLEPNVSESAEPAGEVDLDGVAAEASELETLSHVENDNLKILETEKGFARDREEADDAEAVEATEEEEGAEEEGEPEGEGEDAAEGEGEEDPDAGEVTWQSWLASQDDEIRSGLVDALLDTDTVTIPFKANGEQQSLPLKEILRRAAGYEGQAAAEQKIQTQRSEVQRIQQELQSRESQLKAFQENFIRQVDDPAQFTDWLTKNSDLDYLRSLRDNLDATVNRAEENPDTFNLSRQFSSLEGMVRSLVGSMQGQQAPPTPGGTPTAPQSQAPATLPSDFGFKPGVGYDHPDAAWASLSILTEGSAVTPEQVGEAWAQEGRRRPVFDVARELMGVKKANQKKLDFAAAPPMAKRPTRERVTGKKVSAQAKPPAKPVPFDQIEQIVARQIAAANQAGEL